MKQSQNNNFDQFIKGKLEDASVEAPAFIWEKIERKLPPVLPWYSKYKYLLLLLLLCFTSASSILTYKYFIGDKSKTIALNNLNHFSNNGNNYAINNTSQTDENTSDESVSTKNSVTNTSTKDAEKNEKEEVSVNSFYSEKIDNSIPKTNTNLSELEKRNKRINRFDVKNNANAITTTKESKTTESNTTTATSLENINSDTKIKSIKSKTKKSNYFSENNHQKDNTVLDTTINSIKISPEKFDPKQYNKNTSPKIVLANNNESKRTKVTADNSKEESNLTNNFIANSTDISPIADPVRINESEQLTASVTPLKLNTTPLKSREVLRSLIEPNKLEMLDFAAAAGVQDLNPNKEKMLRNLKQFAGYNINRGFHIGAFISINNIWLSNKKFSSSENVSSIKPKIDFGKSYGLNIGYDYSDHWGFETEIQYAEQGQKYTESNVNGNSSKEINLNYLKLPLLMKYKQSFINNYNSKPIVMSFLFGPQIGFLLKKEMLYNNTKVDCKQNYSKIEAGLAAGIDFDLYMMRYMYLTIGARTGFGTSFKKGVPVSYQLGITTQFNFRIPKKLK